MVRSMLHPYDIFQLYRPWLKFSKISFISSKIKVSKEHKGDEQYTKKILSRMVFTEHE